LETLYQALTAFFGAQPHGKPQHSHSHRPLLRVVCVAARDRFVALRAAMDGNVACGGEGMVWPPLM
jgi:hypothetical protein